MLSPIKSKWRWCPGREALNVENCASREKPEGAPKVLQTAEKLHDLFENAATRLPLKHGLAN